MISETKKMLIKVIGVGGAGGNITNTLVDERLDNVELYVANTDYQDLEKSKVPNKIALGNITQGLGTGGDPLIGARCAKENEKEIKAAIQGADLLVIVAGLGGGTGTGAAPVIAQYAKEANILTLAIVTTPMKEFEGGRIGALAQKGLSEIRDIVNSYMVISNDKLMEQSADVPFTQAWKSADAAVIDTISIISHIVNTTSHMNIDFNDIKSVLVKGGQITFATGKSQGENRIQKALENALTSKNFIEKPQNYGRLIIHYQIDKTTSYQDLLSLKKEILKRFQIGDTIDTQIGISTIDVTDSRDEYFKFSIILTESGRYESEKAQSVIEKNIEKPMFTQQQNLFQATNARVNQNVQFTQERIEKPVVQTPVSQLQTNKIQQPKELQEFDDLDGFDDDITDDLDIFSDDESTSSFNFKNTDKLPNF